MNTEGLRVETAAVLLPDGRVFTLPRPYRHCDVVRVMAYLGIPQQGDHEQGFVLSNGRFCRRTPAKRIAQEAGQLLERAMNLSELYSEDVW